MPTEQELRLHRCCFTGHRPEKIDLPERKVVAALEKEILAAFYAGFFTFISGMARGSDILAAEIVLRLKKKNPSLHLICASPYEGFETSWKQEWQKRYSKIMAEADLVRFICDQQSMSCYQIRNEWMVDHSARVIAVYNGESGGTRTRSAMPKNAVFPCSMFLILYEMKPRQSSICRGFAVIQDLRPSL